ncbi:zinc finger protein 518B [Struthio camelus]|uniref:zinc finger protein 518B n=1 Tax=Struthio camelus TaxID=8801 RepID=UPI003603B47F
MQLKKMREILPKLYPGQLNGKNNSLSTSPKQSSEDRTNPSKGDDDQNCCYQGTEAENNKLSLISCIKCRSVQKISMQDVEKHKKLGWTEDKTFICKKCSHVTPPALHFVPEGASAVGLENREKTSPSKNQKTFKVKNFLPGKYYCDKCRFSTKDPLQYKKHIGQHEEIKFICSHCSYISYTKGEFQRHLVKHTGTFPYQCEYCEYGAVRHDYIVKHTRRVHETPTKRLTNSIINHKQKKSCLPSQSTLFEKQKYDRKIPFRNELSNSSSNTVCEIPDKVTKIVCLSRDIECSINTASIQDKTVLEPSEISICENQSVEVEVYSPKTEPLQPGMPLTVIAPSELVVPSNCLAQIVEIKIVNGAQQLVLKLIPMKEATYRPVNCAEEEPENQGLEPSAEGKKQSSVFQNELLTMEVNVDKLSSVSNQLTSESIYGKNSECLCSSNCQPSDCNSVPIQKEDASKFCFHLVKGIDVHSGVIELCSQALVTSSTEKVSDPKSSRRETDGKNNLHYDLYCYEESLDTSPPKYATTSEDKNSKDVSVKAAQEGKNSSSSAVLKEKDTLPFKSEDNECKSPLVNSPDKHLASKGFNNKSVKSSEAGTFHITKAPPLEDMNVSLSKVKRVDTVNQKNNLLLESLEIQKMENKGNPFEGPIISSVFSLSSGAENVPEGIRWDDTTCSKKSATLLCRKIAQLMSAAESNMKSMPLRCQASSKKVLLPQENSASCERIVPASELEQSASLPELHGGNSVISSEEHDKEQLVTVAKTSKSRVTKNSHVATPVFIPKGTMLRVLNATSSQNTKGIQNRSEASASSAYCNEMLLPRPVPVSVSEKLGSNLPGLSNQTELNAPSRSVSLRQRPKRDESVKNNSKRSVVPYQKSSDVSKQSKLYSKSQGPRNKGKQANFRELPKRKTRTQSETSSGSDMAYLLTARRLRLVPLRMNQLIKCPRRNQPVVVLNHPDVDSPEIINVMKTINKYKGHVLKVVLSERTSSCLGVKRYRKRLTLQNVETGNQAKKQSMLKMKLKKTHKNNYQVVEALPAETLQCMFKCWFCGRVYVDQEEWISHGQRHLIEATKGWDVLSLPTKKHQVRD